MSDPSDKSRRNPSGPLPRTNRPRPDRNRGRKTPTSGEVTGTPPPTSTRSSPESSVLSTPSGAAAQVLPEETPSTAPATQSEARRIDESEALLAERPTQLAVAGPPAEPGSPKPTLSRVLKQASLEMPTTSPGATRNPATPYLGSVIE